MSKLQEHRLKALERTKKNFGIHGQFYGVTQIEHIFNEGYLAGYEAALLPREEKEDEIPS